MPLRRKRLYDQYTNEIPQTGVANSATGTLFSVFCFLLSVLYCIELNYRCDESLSLFIPDSK
jgi:hypothetical protein